VSRRGSCAHKNSFSVCLDWGVDVWGFEGVDVWGCEKKMRLFGLGYVRVNVWGKFVGVCEWCNYCEVFLIFLKV